jgi:hypothetical protein
MGIRLKVGVEGKLLSRAIANLGTTIKRPTDIHLSMSRECIHKDMLASNCLPYQAPRAYRAIIIEADCRRAQRTVEVQRSLSRV